jgi:hypothetical protein
MRYFRMTMPSAEIPRCATLAIDETRRKLVAGETFGFRNPSGAFFNARIDSLSERKGASVS